MLALSACSNDDNPTSETVYKTHAEIKFSFEEYPDFADKFDEVVKSVSLYVFDENDIFVKVYEEPGTRLSKDGYTLSVNGLAPGKYSCIAWCGLKDADNGKSDFTITDMKEGVSTREEMICRMNTKDLNGEIISDTNLKNLFYGSLTDLKISEGRAADSLVYTIELIQDTKEVNVILQGAGDKSLNVSDYEVRIEADNAMLGWDNVPIDREKVVYTPYSIEEIQLEGKSSKNVLAKLKVNRLMDGSKALLIVSSKDNPGEVLAQIPLVDYILKASPTYIFPEGEEKTPQLLLDKVNSFEMTVGLNVDKE